MRGIGFKVDFSKPVSPNHHDRGGGVIWVEGVDEG
jgi:hypothetical protein